MKNLLASPAAVREGLLPCLREDARLWFSEQPADLEQAKAALPSLPAARALPGRRAGSARAARGLGRRDLRAGHDQPAEGAARPAA